MVSKFRVFLQWWYNFFILIDFKSPQKVLLEDGILSCYFVKGGVIFFSSCCAGSFCKYQSMKKLNRTEAMMSKYLQTTNFFYATGKSR